MLDTEAALARALERAGLAARGRGRGGDRGGRRGLFDLAALGRQAALDRQPGARAGPRRCAGRCPAGGRGAVHRGATSQDIIDTAAMLLARRALAAIVADLAAAADAAAGLAAAHRDTLMIGRTLLQQAVPVTFGLVAAGWLTGLDEARDGPGPGRPHAAGRAVRRRRGHAGRAGRRRARGSPALLAEELGLAVPRAALAHRPAADHRGRPRRCAGAAACSARSPGT